MMARGPMLIALLLSPLRPLAAAAPRRASGARGIPHHGARQALSLK